MNYINLAHLPKAARRPVWDAICTHRPKLAAMLQDQSLRQLVETFDGEVSIKRNDLGPEVLEVINHYAEHQA